MTGKAAIERVMRSPTRLIEEGDNTPTRIWRDFILTKNYSFEFISSKIKQAVKRGKLLGEKESQQSTVGNTISALFGQNITWNTLMRGFSIFEPYALRHISMVYSRDHTISVHLDHHWGELKGFKGRSVDMSDPENARKAKLEIRRLMLKALIKRCQEELDTIENE